MTSVLHLFDPSCGARLLRTSNPESSLPSQPRRTHLPTLCQARRIYSPQEPSVRCQYRNHSPRKNQRTRSGVGDAFTPHPTFFLLLRPPSHRFIRTLLTVLSSLVMSYSSFFSSGLSAIQHLTPPTSPTQPVRPDSPIVPLTPTRESTGITDEDPTPTAASVSQQFGSERPKLRKRRSSLTVNTSPLVQLKGSYRGVTTAIQRQNRIRSGSVNDFSQPHSTGLTTGENQNSIPGRLRSGSVGNSHRCASLFFFHPVTHGVLTCDIQVSPCHSRSPATPFYAFATFASPPFLCSAAWKLRFGSGCPSSPHVSVIDHGEPRTSNPELTLHHPQVERRPPVQT